jgi:hypothetical protein
MHKKSKYRIKNAKNARVKSRKARGPGMSFMRKPIYNLEGNVAFPFTPHPEDLPMRQSPPSSMPRPDAKRRLPKVKIISDGSNINLGYSIKNKPVKYANKANSEEEEEGDWGQFQHINFEEVARGRKGKITKRRHHKKGKKTMHKRH